VKPGKLLLIVVLLLTVLGGSASAALCTYSISPSNASVSPGGGTGTVAVTTTNDCSWTASSNAAWLTVSAGASGAGGGTVTYTAAANPGSSPRTGILTIAGQTFTLDQAGSAPAGANLLVNGSFEQPGGGERRGLTRNSAYLTGWVVTRDTIDYFGGLYTCSDGDYCVDLDGDPGYGSITQSFATTPGVDYTLSFDLAGNPDGPPLTKRIRVMAAGQQAEFVFSMLGTTRANPGWIPLTWNFTANNPTTTLEFQSLDTTGSYYGPLLDNVRVLGSAGGLTCSYTVSPATQSVGADGGTLSIRVSAAAGCAWTATAEVPWITITSGASGSGLGTVTYAVSANSSGALRTGNITAAGQTVAVMQAGLPGACMYNLAPSLVSLGVEGTNSGTIVVSTASNCGWSASTTATWITITSGAGAGNGTVTFTVAPNTGLPRSATIAVVGQTVTVNQAGTGGACSYEISPAIASAPAEGISSGSLTVTAPANCAWTATASPGWIEITSGASGAGNGTVRYSVAANAGSTRTGSITITGQTGAIGVIVKTHTISQAAAGGGGCTYGIAPPSASVPAEGTVSGTIAVAATSGCGWTAASDSTWITITSSASGTGSGAVSYSVAANTGAARTGTITIAGQSHTVNQASGCTYGIAPPSASVPAAGTTLGSIAVAAVSGCAWTATSAVPWITVTSGASGAGSGAVSYTVAANTGAARTAAITIAGQTHTVSQAAGSGVQPQPAINTGGVVNAADYTASLAVGGIFSVFGTNLASGARSATSIPLPVALDGVSVEVVDGARVLNAPLFFTSAGQINAQVPFDITSSSVQVRVRSSQGLSSAQTVSILPRAPRLFTKTLDGKGEAILVHADYTVVSASAPASPSEIVILYLTGLGGVSPSITAGQAGGDGAVGGPLNRVNEEVIVTVDGRPAKVDFAGLAPYFVGLYQINFQVPEGAAAGMPAITVRAAQQESQAGVTFACGAK